MRFEKEVNIFSKDAILKRFKANETDIQVVQGRISAIISESELIELQNGKATMYSKLASAAMDIDSMQLDFSNLATKYDTVTEQYSSLNSRVAQYKASVDGLSVNLSSVQKNLQDNYSTTSAMDAAIKAGVEEVSSRLSKVDGRVTAAESTIRQHAADISLLVKESDVNGDYLIGKINLSGTTAAIEAKHIKLSGSVTLSDWGYDGDKTCINGAKIYTGTVTADKIAAKAVTAEKMDVTSLSAITANLGTVTAGVLKSQNYSWTEGNYFTDSGTYISLATGAIWTKSFTVDQSGNAYFRGKLNGASGSFSGTITSTAGSIGGWTIESKMLRCGPDFTLGDYLGSAANTNAGVYLSADGGMARFMKYESTYVSSAGRYNNVIRETRIVGGETTGYKATYNNLIVTTEASFYKPSKMYGLSHVTSGGHLVFASDGTTLAYLASSSRRYKDYIRDISDSDIENLWSLPVVYAKYKDGYLATDDPCNGKALPMFFAEDVEWLLPDAAVYQNGVVEDWNYRVMIPAMEKQIQVLHKDDARLDSRTEFLERELISLQYQLQQALIQIGEQRDMIDRLLTGWQQAV